MTDASGDTWSRTVEAVLSRGGGDTLVLDALQRVPQVREVTVKTGWRSSVRAVAVGDRRFRAAGDGRLVVEHVVNDVVLSSSALGPSDAARAVAAALTTHVRHFGAGVQPEIEAAVAGLDATL